MYIYIYIYIYRYVYPIKLLLLLHVSSFLTLYYLVLHTASEPWYVSLCELWLFYRYVALSDNSNSNYKARELKSVHVDAVGVFVKFVIHKNHINKHNLYNQVSEAVFKMSRTELQKLEMKLQFWQGKCHRHL